MNMQQKVDPGESLKLSRLEKTEAYALTRGAQVDAFLDRNGYTVKEVRGIARHAILLWETQGSGAAGP